MGRSARMSKPFSKKELEKLQSEVMKELSRELMKVALSAMKSHAKTIQKKGFLIQRIIRRLKRKK